MGAIPTSPAVVFLEKDNSSYPPSIDSSIVGVVGFATKGPVDKPKLVTSAQNLLNLFGNPSESLPGQGLEGAMEILETTNQIRYVRTLGSTGYANASATMLFGTCPAIQFSTSGFGITNPLYLSVSVSNNYSAPIITNKIYSIPSSNNNIANGISQAVAINNAVGTGDSKTDPIFMISDAYGVVSGGVLVCSYAGSGVRLEITAASGLSAGSLDSTKKIPILAPINFNGVVSSTPGSQVSMMGTTVTQSTLSYLVKSLYPGSGYNLGKDQRTGAASGVSVEIASYTNDSVISINSDGIASEIFTVNLTGGEKFIEEIINIGTDNATSDLVMGEIVGIPDQLISAKKLGFFSDNMSTLINSTVTLQTSGILVTGANPRFLKLIEQTVPLTSGSDGTMAEIDVIGNAADKTGIYALDDDLLNISMGIMPGINNQSAQNAFITLAETSQNFLAAVSPSFGADTVEEAVDWMNGKGNGRTAAINSSWASVFWPWVQVYNTFDKKDMWYDPAIFAIRQMAFTDNVGETWFAPAGFRRGRLTKPTNTEVPLNLGDRNILYVNNINPVVNFAPEGITIFGQKTAQRAPSALDRINVRRLMIFLRKVLLQTGRQDLFEPNDKFTWEIVKDKADNLLADIQARRGVTDFKVICDETTNTPLRVDRNELWCKILLKPTKTAEWIIFEVNLTSQSAKFNG